MTYSLDIDGNDQTPYVRDQSITCKFNTLDLVLIDPAYPPKVGDVLTQFDPDWDGDVVRVEITDAAGKGAHTLFNISATNTDLLVTSTAPFNLSDTPNLSTTFGYKNLSTVVTKTTDATISATETTGRCTVFREGLRAGMRINLTSVNHGYAAQTFTINQVTVRYPAKETDPAFDIEFGDTLKPLSQLIHNPAPNCDVVAATDATAAVQIANSNGVWPGVYPYTSTHCGANFHQGNASMASTAISVTPGLAYDCVLLIDANKHAYTPSVSFHNAANALISTTSFPLGVIGTDKGVECVIRHLTFEPPALTDHIHVNFNGKLGGWTYQAHLDLVTPGTDPIPDPDPFCLVDGPGTSPYQMMSDDPRVLRLVEQMEELVSAPDPDAAPASPNAIDDEFEVGDTIDTKWTKTNDPAGADAMDQTTYSGYFRCGLVELGTDNVANYILLQQTAPTGTAVARYRIKFALSMGGLAGEHGEFASCTVCLIDTVAGAAVGAGVQYNNATAAMLMAPLPQKDAGGVPGNMATAEVARGLPFPSQWMYAELRKTTTAAYTSANTYEAWISLNGVTWQQIGTDSVTFANTPTVGISIRRPKSQAGTPAGEVLVQFFRKTL